MVAAELPFSFWRRARTVVLSALLATGPVHAARPLVTDDARTVDAHACQVESWIRDNRGSKEYWALPACNFTGNLELTLGGAKTRDPAGTETTDVLLQAKTLFKPLETNGYGIGFAAGYNARPADNPERKLLGNPYFYVPISFSLKDDLFVLHTNLGARHARDQGRTLGTWGIGSETKLSDRVFIIAETYGETRGNPSYQIGVRYWIVPNHMQIDTTYGNRFGTRTDNHWISVGLRLLSVPFLK